MAEHLKFMSDPNNYINNYMKKVIEKMCPTGFKAVNLCCTNDKACHISDKLILKHSVPLLKWLAAALFVSGILVSPTFCN